MIKYIKKLWYENRLSKHTIKQMYHKAEVDYSERKQIYYFNKLKEL